jgi:hypothetical protein
MRTAIRVATCSACGARQRLDLHQASAVDIPSDWLLLQPVTNLGRPRPVLLCPVCVGLARVVQASPPNVEAKENPA